MTGHTPGPARGRDHGGGLDAAVARWGGARGDWLDLSTGINPVPWPVGALAAEAWTALPDAGAMDRLLDAARAAWAVPEGARIIAAPGASALIARLPDLARGGAVHVPGPTYNEHAAAFAARGWRVAETEAGQPVRVLVHPNNPDGRLWPASAVTAPGQSIVDESFCDIAPGDSHVALTDRANDRADVIILKSFGKFWGLAGLRLGFAIARPDLLAGMEELLGPWAVSGPALEIGAQALSDRQWAAATRARLAADADRLDLLMTRAGAGVVGGTSLFRLYEVDDAARWRDRLARGQVWSRIFPYSQRWLRLGLPHPDRWAQLEAALCR